MYVRIMLATPVQVATAALRAAHESLAACDLDMLTGRELLTVLDELETLSCQLPAQWHRALARLQAETTPKELGAKTGKTSCGSGGASLPPRPTGAWPRPRCWGRGAR